MVFAGAQTEGLSTLTMVIILTLAVKSVFLCFALMAVCYRYRKTLQEKGIFVFGLVVFVVFL